MTEKAIINERARQRMERDYDPNQTAGVAPAPDVRIANALEYIAFQIGQINRKLDGITGPTKDKR